MVQTHPHHPAAGQFTTLVDQHAFEDAATLLVEQAPSFFRTESVHTWFARFQQLPPPVHAARPDLLLLAGDVWRVRDDWSEASRYYHQALHAAQTTVQPSRVVQAICRQALVCWHRGDAAGALARYEEAMTLVDPAMLPSDVGYDLDSGYALALSSVGRLADAEGCLQRQLRHAQRSGQHDHEWMLLNDLGVMVYLRRGAFHMAERTLREGLRLAQAHQHPLGEAYLTNSLAYTLNWHGHTEGALALSARAYTLGQRLGIPNVQAFALLNQAWALCQAGDGQAAGDACADGLACLDSPHSSPLWCDLLMLQSQLHRPYALTMAHQVAQDALAAARVQGDQWTTGLVLLHVAEVCLACEQVDHAEAALADARAIFMQYDDRYHRRRCQFLAAQLALRQQAWDTFGQYLAALFTGPQPYLALTAQMIPRLSDLLVAIIDQHPDHARDLQSVASAWAVGFAALVPTLLAHPSTTVRAWTAAIVADTATPHSAAHPPMQGAAALTTHPALPAHDPGPRRDTAHVGNLDEVDMLHDVRTDAAPHGAAVPTDHQHRASLRTNVGAPCDSNDALRASLTPTEWQVVQVLRDGKTNQQIATQLCISARAVRFHLTNIYTKLGVANPSQAVAWIVAHNPHPN